MARPLIPVDASLLKHLLRVGLDSQISRAFWWPILPTLRLDHPEDVIDSDNDVVGSAERLCELLQEPLLSFVQGNMKDSEFVEAATRKLAVVLVSKGKVTPEDVHYWLPLARLLLWQIKRIDLVYYVLGVIMEQEDRYFSPTPKGLHVIFYTFREILRSFMPKTHSALKTIGALEDKYLSILFVDYFAELLPQSLLLPLMDAYLYEGVKVLFRYSLALIAGYKGRVKEGKYQSGRDFWSAIKADCISASTTLRSPTVHRLIGLEDVLPSIDAFSVKENSKNEAFFVNGTLKQDAFEVGRSIFARLSKPTGVTRANIRALERAASLIEDQDIYRTVSRKAATAVQTKSIAEKVLDSRLRQSLSSRNSFSAVSMSSMTPNGSPVKSVTRAIDVGVESTVSPTEVSDLGTEVQSIVSQSELLSYAQAEALLSCLPESLALEGLELAFSTHEHGHSLSSLYSYTKGLSPIVLIVRPLELNRHSRDTDGAIIGATICDTISPPDAERVRGEGKNSRVFVINADSVVNEGAPRCAVLDWIANHDTELLNKEQSAHRSAESDRDAAYLSAVSQFCMARSDSLSFGASLQHGTSCLHINEALSTLTLGVSDTFNNSRPLLVETSAGAQSTTTRVVVRDIEVFSGRTSKRRADLEGRFAHKSSVVRDVEKDLR